MCPQDFTPPILSFAVPDPSLGAEEFLLLRFAGRCYVPVAIPFRWRFRRHWPLGHPTVLPLRPHPPPSQFGCLESSMLRVLALVVGLSLCGTDLPAQDFSVSTKVP